MLRDASNESCVHYGNLLGNHRSKRAALAFGLLKSVLKTDIDDNTGEREYRTIPVLSVPGTALRQGCVVRLKRLRGVVHAQRSPLAAQGQPQKGMCRRLLRKLRLNSRRWVITRNLTWLLMEGNYLLSI